MFEITNRGFLTEIATLSKNSKSQDGESVQANRRSLRSLRSSEPHRGPLPDPVGVQGRDQEVLLGLRPCRHRHLVVNVWLWGRPFVQLDRVPVSGLLLNQGLGK